MEQAAYDSDRNNRSVGGDQKQQVKVDTQDLNTQDVGRELALAGLKLWE